MLSVFIQPDYLGTFARVTLLPPLASGDWSPLMPCPWAMAQIE